MFERTPSDIAVEDQVWAEVTGWASQRRRWMSIYIEAGFTNDQAFALMMHDLAAAASTPVVES